MNLKKQGYNIVSNCRISNSKNINNILNFGEQPLANSFKERKDDIDKKFPLSISYCHDSSLVQLNETVEKEILFDKYFWTTGTSLTTKSYIESFIKNVIRNTNINKNDFILEIASNDGTLLKTFVKKGYNNILGVDPAKNLAKKANDNGVKTLSNFWDFSLASTIVKKYNYAKLLIARNVIPHVSDLIDVIKGIELILRKDGVGIIEFHSATKIQQELHYDSIYHEHLCYFSIKSISFLLNKFNLYPFHVEKSPISGGSLVIYFSKEKKSKTKELEEAINYEDVNKINNFNSWLNFADRVHKHRLNTQNILGNLNTKKIIGFGSSARSQTYLNFCGIDFNTISAIIDNNSIKQNLYSPGSSIPVVSFAKGMSMSPDIIIILAWNFKDEIIKACLSNNFIGKFLIPFPNDLKIIAGK
jgi:hypothetical protein